MRLSLLLLVLAHRLRRATRTRTPFRSHLGNVRLRILVRTRDRRRGRVFVFDRGRFASHRGAHHASDAALVWSDAATAYRVLASRREEDFFLAAAQGRVWIEGMAAYVQWFTDGVKLAM